VAPRPPVRAALGRPDRLLTGAVLALVSFGLVMVFSASSATALLEDSQPTALVVRQAIYAAVGLGAYLVAARMRPDALGRLAAPVMVVSVVLLLAVLVPGLGSSANGARRWIDLGPLQIQPAELAKVAVVIWIAAAAARASARMREGAGLRPYLLLTGIVVLLVLVEPDLGTAAVIAVTALVMLAVAGARPRHLAVVTGGTLALAALAIAVEPYRRERLLAFLDPWHDKGDTGFQVVQAAIALGSGGFHGVGLGNGLQKVFYLPEAHTDMIAATVGEELGLLGILALIAGFGAVAVAGYRIAHDAKDLHQQVLAAGLTTLVVVQAVVNLGAVLGLLPVTGVPLPFVSYGGSSLVVFLASTGLLVNIGRHGAAANRRLEVVAPDGAEGRDRRGGHGRPRHAGARAG
jgi:cell division protein FtsW